jgi:hypothetical protein
MDDKYICSLNSAPDIQEEEKMQAYTLKSLEDVRGIREVWEKMQPHPYADIDYYLSMFESCENVIGPYVLLLRRNNMSETMLIGKIEDIRFNCRIGYKDIFRPVVRCLTIIDSGIIGVTERSHCEIIFSQIAEFLKTREVDIVFFKEIPIDSALFLSSGKAPFICGDAFPIINLHYRMTLPNSFGDFMKQRKNKGKLRQTIKRLHKEFPDSVTIRNFQKPEDVQQLCEEAENVSKKTFQYNRGEGFENSIENRTLLKKLAEKGALKAFILYIKDAPCAYFAGFKFKGTHYFIPFGGTGYDPIFGKFGVGTILLLHMIEDLCNDKEVQYVDFGAFDMQYKRRFCDISWKDANFYIYQPTIKGVCLNFARTLCSTVNCMGGTVLSTLKLEERWKKFKRIRFTPESQDEGG